jgi:diguanylate cyclase (GGDEF)-like protein
MGIIDSFSQLIFNVYEAFTVAFFIRENEHLRCLSSVSFANSFDKNRLVPIDGSLPGWIIKHNEPLIVPNFDKDEGTLGYYGADEEIKSFMGYPMEESGVIIIDSKKKWVFTDKEKKILGSFVTLIQAEIEREKRSQEMEEALEELHGERKILGLFHELNLAHITVKEIFLEALSLADADVCFVAVESNGKLVVRDTLGIIDEAYVSKACQADSSIASVVLEGERELLLPYNSGFLREKPLFFPGEAIKARQFFGFPLITNEATIGVAGFASLSDRKLRDKSIGLLRSISALLALYYSSLWMRESLEKLKDFEPVTGSIQFNTFLGITEKAIKKGKRFALLSVKLNNLDVYNRAMGHELANELLQKVFQVIRHCAGGDTLITRKGGGHFYVLMKETETLGATNMLRILNYTISKNISEQVAVDRKNVADLGVAHFPEDGGSVWELLDCAKDKKIRAA